MAMDREFPFLLGAEADKPARDNVLTHALSPRSPGPRATPITLQGSIYGFQPVLV